MIPSVKTVSSLLQQASALFGRYVIAKMKSGNEHECSAIATKDLFGGKEANSCKGVQRINHATKPGSGRGRIHGFLETAPKVLTVRELEALGASRIGGGRRRIVIGWFGLRSWTRVGLG